MASVSQQILLGSAAVRTQGNIITGGTNIGNLTVNGGLAAAFDGVTNQGGGVCAAVGGTNGYVGKSISKRVYGATVYGSNDNGYDAANPSITITLYGKIGAAPANGTDGTILGSVTFTDTANESGNPHAITSNDNETVWAHTWINVTGSTSNVLVAEAQIYESV